MAKDMNDHLLDLQGLVNEIIASGLDPSIFDEELDVEWAKNVIEWAVSPEFLGMETLWAKQAEQAVRLFAEWCPECTDMDFFNDVPVDATIGTFRSHVTLLDYGICPECKKNKCELFDKLPWELVSCLGQRSGKTALTAGVISTYHVHLFLKYPNPARFYGVMQNSFFEITFVAVTAGQVKRTLWTAFKEAINQSPWFQDYIGKLKRLEKENGLDKGALVKVMDSFILFGNKRLGCSYAAADMKSLRGSTRISASIDELSWFGSADSVRANAEETYAALSNSLKTIRAASDIKWKEGDYRTLPAYMCNISSPSSQYDKMMGLLKESKRDNRKVAFHLASWEASPLITRESLETEESNDPIKFWRDFGAVPPLADSPFISSIPAIRAMQYPAKPLINWRVKYVKDKVDPKKNRYIAAELVGSFSDSRARMVPRLITVDCGETQNSFCIMISHMKSFGDSGYQVVVDTIISAKPEKILETGEVIPVHFPTMFGIIRRLCDRSKGLFVRGVIYDRWQSTGQIQELREIKIRAEKYSPKEADFKLLQHMVYAGQITQPKWEHKELSDLDISNIAEVRKAPYTEMAIQFATVRAIGRKIVKPEVGDDDAFRCAVLATHHFAEHKKDFITSSSGFGKSDRTYVGNVGMKSSSNYGSYNGSRARTTIGSVRGKSGLKKRRY